jgi:hypothetical protein
MYFSLAFVVVFGRGGESGFSPFHALIITFGGIAKVPLPIDLASKYL